MSVLMTVTDNKLYAPAEIGEITDLTSQKMTIVNRDGDYLKLEKLSNSPDDLDKFVKFE